MIQLEDTFSTEFRLAAACAVWPPCKSRSLNIASLAERSIDWDRFLRIVESHDIVALAREGLGQAGDVAPLEVMRALDVRAAAQTADNLARAAQSIRLQRVLDEAGVRARFLKGVTLGLLAFGDIGLRAGKDIDVLVARDELSVASVALERAGYRQFSPSPDLDADRSAMVMRHRKDVGFVHEQSGICVELHWKLFLNPHAMAWDGRGEQVVQLSKGVGLRTLADADLFSYLCMHGAYHWWRQLKWLADIAALVARTDAAEVERYLHVATAQGAGRAAAQALLLCNRILSVDLALRPAMARPGRVVTWLTNTAMLAVSAGSEGGSVHATRFGTTRGSLSALLLGKGLRFYWSELSQLAFNEADISSVALPRYLRLLYPILRLPLWAVRQARQAKTKATSA